MCLHIVHGDIVLYLVTFLVFRAVGVMPGYGLGGLEFVPSGVPRGGWRGFILVQTVLEAHSQWVPGLFPEGKAAGAWR